MKERNRNKESANGKIMPDPLKDSLLKRRKELEKAINNMRKTLQSAPEGRLRVAPCGGSAQYFCRSGPEDKHGTYIAKQNHALAAALAQKDYCERMTAELEKELASINRMLRAYHPEKIEDIYSGMHPARRILIEPVYLPQEEFAAHWQSREYAPKGFDPNDNSEYYTARGERVRSKSEILIADALQRQGIPYRYEFPIRMEPSGRVYHPDFYCLNVRSRREFAWEHLGMLGNEEYADINLKKIENYENSGYYPGINLILTMESMNCPLSTKMINRNIEKYLL